MSETTTAPVAIDTNRSGIPFGRLIGVEIRKMFDTLAGRWLIIVTGGLLLLVMAIILLVMALVDDASITAQGFSEGMTFALSILLPVFAITSVTSEWGQRNHLTLFTLEPHRLRVFMAKLAAVFVLALSTIVVAIAFGAVGNVLYGVLTGNEVVWNVDVSMLAWTVGLQLAYFLMAFALATLLLNTPAAIVVFYAFGLLLPIIVYSPLLFVFEWARAVLPWIDFNIAAQPMMLGMDFLGEPIDTGAFEIVRFLFALVLWIVVPGVLGLNRVLRTEIK